MSSIEEGYAAPYDYAEKARREANAAPGLSSHPALAPASRRCNGVGFIWDSRTMLRMDCNECGGTGNAGEHGVIALVGRCVQRLVRFLERTKTK